MNEDVQLKQRVEQGGPDELHVRFPFSDFLRSCLAADDATEQVLAVAVTRTNDEQVSNGVISFQALRGEIQQNDIFCFFVFQSVDNITRNF